MIFTRSISNFWKIWNDTSPRPTGRGFLLPCTDTAQGFSFCPVAHKPHTSRLQRLSCCQCNYTATTSKAFTGLCSGLSADLPYSSAHGTAYTRAAYIPPAPRRTRCRPAQPPYYNNVYKGARVRPCYGSMPDGAAYRRPCQPGGVSIPTAPGGLHSGTGSA